MKILFVSTRYHPNEVGGAEVTVRLLAEGLVRTGGEATVVSLAPEGERSTSIINGVRSHYLPLFNVYFPHDPKPRAAWQKMLWQLIEAWNPVMSRRLSRIIDQENPDLVHVHNLLGFSGAIWPAVARKGIPILQTLHDHYFACTSCLMYRPDTGNCARRCLRCRLLCMPRQVSARHVNGLTTVSTRLWKRIGSNGQFPGSRFVRVINNCNAHPPATDARPGPRPDTPLRVGFLGRLEPVKGPHVLLEAAQRIGADRLQVRLGGSGSATYKEDLKSRFLPPLAMFQGHVSPPEFFQDIDVLVVPSLVEEASPRVIHEAYGFGVPVIGVAAGGVPELIEEGRTGFIVPTGDVAALETLLRQLLDAPPNWVALSSACLQASERFTFDRIFSEYRAAWQDVMLASRAASSRGSKPIRGVVTPASAVDR